ncbi:MAG: pantoate--beta-alanine ligase [Rubripirellula sp.]|nr:pantoate--beta-alanine ligase [Rhodopirellula sp.]MCH1439301.1 pantoate--beta-alanine ligase [Rubripirellula sp.]OUX06245.1 MAG: pantoate--beta-alanine ligase [Planctomycetaceae bacterium TMED240]
MEVFNSPEAARVFVSALRSQGRTVGFVPTMGALHAGHLSLVESARSCDAVVASIYVNPTQFGPNEDLAKYPRTLNADLEQLRSAGVSAVFVPTNEQMYPDGFSTTVEPPRVSETLEGTCRPGHFRGVVTVVLKLLNAVPASHAYFGKKDYQQWRVIEAMSHDLNVGTKIIGCETVREADGLAMSSRNRYLTVEQRARALLLSETLQHVETAFRGGEIQTDILQNSMRRMLLGENVSATTANAPNLHRLDTLQYAQIVSAHDLTPLSSIDRPAVALIAGMIGTTRLIDNRELTLDVN